MAAVKAHRNPPGGRLGALLQDDLGKSLSGVTDYIQVHPVDAHAHDAAKAGSTEFQRAEEAGFDLLLVPRDGRQLSVLLRREDGAVEPGLIRFLIRHRDNLLFLTCGNRSPRRS